MIPDPAAEGRVARFEAAVVAGLDPTNSGAADEAVTTIDCAWVGLICDRCGHVFRIDDPVRLGADREGLVTVRHLDPDLGCAVTARPRPVSTAVQRVLDALNDADPVGPDLTLRYLQPHDELLGDGLRRPCKWCGDPLRPHETVVVCPCGHGCSTAIHLDLNRGLLCFERWCPDHRVQRCLMTRLPLAAR